MKNICFHFQISQPYRLRNYRFFDINKNHDYVDEFQNNYLTNRLAERCYLPANEMLGKLIKAFPEVAFSFSIAGSSLELFEAYCPQVLQSFKKLFKTGRVELTGNTLTHSLASLHSKSAFMEQVHLQEALLKQTFDVKPTTFCNTEIIYSDEIGEWLHEAGYTVVLTEGARHILGWKNPGYLYCNPFRTELRLLLRDYHLCDDITLRFEDKSWNQYPLTAERYMGFLNGIDPTVPYLNLYMDYETIGEIHPKESGIFDFFDSLVRQLVASKNYRFILPHEVAKSKEKVSTMHAPWPISCSGEEKDTAEWIGNEMQQEAFEQLYKLEPLYLSATNQEAKKNWLRLQAADHFQFMATKWLPQSAVRRNFDVYPSPYNAFINFMNVLNDVQMELKRK
jgi:alpha-amylase